MSNTNRACVGRMTKELEMLSNDPGPGISAWAIDSSNIMNLQAQIQGPQDTPYSEGIFTLSIQIPDRYPFEPPRVRFVTPIYHPNIDSDGRICLDTLKMQPAGSWSPSININTLLLTIRILIGSPNADDGLVPDITEEYKRDRTLWKRKALDFTRLHAQNFSDISNLISPTTESKDTSNLNTDNNIVKNNVIINKVIENNHDSSEYETDSDESENETDVNPSKRQRR